MECLLVGLSSLLVEMGCLGVLEPEHRLFEARHSTTSKILLLVVKNKLLLDVKLLLRLGVHLVIHGVHLIRLLGCLQYRRPRNSIFFSLKIALEEVRATNRATNRATLPGAKIEWR